MVLLLECRSMPPALFPVMSSDGILKPAVLLLVEEAIEAGMQRVVIVVSKVNNSPPLPLWG